MVGGIEVSLVGIAWGPEDAGEMISKSVEDVRVKKPEFYPDRPYVLGLKLHVNMPKVASVGIGAQSGLVLIKNVDGDIQQPMELTSAGFVPFSGSPGVFDIRLNGGNSTEFWDLFPAATSQKEFLFEVLSAVDLSQNAGSTRLSFKIIRKDEDFVIVDTSPNPGTTCRSFAKNFAGTIGARALVRLQLTREGTTISGTEQYWRVGKTLKLQGLVDALGNLKVEERYPEDIVTGILKGKLSNDCGRITGLFSKPDGSSLQPFDFHEERVTADPVLNPPDEQ